MSMTLPPPEPTIAADANVFHSRGQRNILMTLAVECLIELRLTNVIERERVNSLECLAMRERGAVGNR